MDPLLYIIRASGIWVCLFAAIVLQRHKWPRIRGVQRVECSTQSAPAVQLLQVVSQQLELNESSVSSSCRIKPASSWLGAVIAHCLKDFPFAKGKPGVIN